MLYCIKNIPSDSTKLLPEEFRYQNLAKMFQLVTLKKRIEKMKHKLGQVDAIVGKKK